MQGGSRVLSKESLCRKLGARHGYKVLLKVEYRDVWIHVLYRQVGGEPHIGKVWRFHWADLVVEGFASAVFDLLWFDCLRHKKQYSNLCPNFHIRVSLMLALQPFVHLWARDNLVIILKLDRIILPSS